MKMKKMWMWAVALLMVATAEAQERKTDEKKTVTVETADSTATDEAEQMLRRGDRKGELVLAVGSQQITLGATKEPRTKGLVEVRGSKNNWEFGWGAIEIGYSLLTSIDYDGYTPAEHGYLDQQMPGSVHIGWRVFNAEFSLNRKGTISLATGLSVGWDNYRLNPAWTLDKVDGKIVPIALEEGKRKSKLVTTYWGLCLGMKFYPARHLELSVFGYGELITDAWTKVTKPKEKHDMQGLNTFQFGVEATITYRQYGIFFKHSVTPLFKTDVGPKCFPYSVGVAWGF